MKILITGLISSGKTTFSRLLQRCLKYKMINADLLAKKLRQKKEVKNRIIQTFGFESRQNLTEKLREILKDFHHREKLNAILHPLIAKEIKNNVDKYNNIIVDAPIPKSLGILTFFDRVFLVTSSKKNIKERMKHLNFDIKTQKEILRVQEIEFKNFKADFHINNNKGVEELEKIALYYCNLIKHNRI